MDGPDFVVSELLSELKEGNIRKDQQIHRLQRTLLAVVLAAFIVVLSVVGVFVWYLNQYDFVSSDTTTYDASGVYAIIDSDGNVVGQDFTADEINKMLEVLNNGEGDSGQDQQPVSDPQQ